MALRSPNVVCMVTGGSRGIGQQIARQMAQQMGVGSRMLLTSQSAERLEAAASQIRDSDLDGVVQVETLTCDLHQVTQKAVEFRAKLNELASTAPIDVAVVFHNAGSVGDVSMCAADMAESSSVAITDYFHVNYLSMVVLNSIFLETMKAAKVVFVVNITSKCAIAGFVSMSQYSAAKGAREAFMRVLAAENSSLRVLNYSPGPVDTDMTTEIINKTFSGNSRALFQDMRANKTILSSQQSVSKMMGILNANQFESGARIDYYDE